MLIKVRDKSFSIDLVNNWVYEKYGEMHDVTSELQELYLEIEELQEKEDIDAKAVRAFIRKANAERKAKIKQIVELRWLIIEELLIRNNIEFDRNWWERQTSVDDMNDFVYDCIQSNKAENKSKKK